jgi:hypothetical protein
MKLLLPFTDMMSRPKDAVDPFAAVGGEGKVYSMMRDALSPLHLSALGVHTAWTFLLHYRVSAADFSYC